MTPLRFPMIRTYRIPEEKRSRAAGDLACVEEPCGKPNACVPGELRPGPVSLVRMAWLIRIPQFQYLFPDQLVQVMNSHGLRRPVQEGGNIPDAQVILPAQLNENLQDHGCRDFPGSCNRCCNLLQPLQMYGACIFVRHGVNIQTQMYGARPCFGTGRDG